MFVIPLGQAVKSTTMGKRLISYLPTDQLLSIFCCLFSITGSPSSSCAGVTALPYFDFPGVFLAHVCAFILKLYVPR